MNAIKTNSGLPDPFPTEDLRTLSFGSADGHRDNIPKKAFIETSSIKQFYLNEHSIIIGAIGTGKSTLFNLLKNHSRQLENYKLDLIVPIEEALSFKELNSFIKDYYADKDESVLYQLIWKYSILLRISNALSKLDNFPSNKNERSVNQFLLVSGSADAYTSILDKFKSILTKANLKIEAKIGDNPISLETGFADHGKDKQKLSLEDVEASISESIRARGYNRTTVIIDKIDKFVAGAEYHIQKKYINALLEVDDDFSSTENICLKIFIRADLFNRLDFSALGYDKVQDNSITLKWSDDETIRFLAQRIVLALVEANICSTQDLYMATDLSELNITWKQKLVLNNRIPDFLKRIFNIKEKTERKISLFKKFDRAMITKLFPRTATHYCANKHAYEDVDIFEFINSHFLDGNNVCTPRYMLIFLKEVIDKVSSYYEENPDQIAMLISHGYDLEWDLFKKQCVYDAYISAKNIYVKNIESVDIKWTKYFNVFLDKRGNKTKFDYKWIRANILDISETEAVDFLSFLQVIGFLKITSAHQDIRKRGYELPILFKVSV